MGGPERFPHLLFVFLRKLRQYHRNKYEDAACQFGYGQQLMQDQPTENHGKNRFQSHQQRCDSWIQSLLTIDLQALCNTHTQSAGIKQGNAAI